MTELPIEPVIIVNDTPKPRRRLATLSQAKSFVEEELRRGRPPAWRAANLTGNWQSSAPVSLSHSDAVWIACDRAMRHAMPSSSRE